MPKMTITKSILIDAAPEKNYPIISNLKNWNTWSPWVIAEPTAMIKVSEDGKFHDWDGDIIGSLAHNDHWFLFDQLLFSENWNKEATLFLLKTTVFNPGFLYTKRSNYQGYPYRTRILANRLQGYSDHFPVYAVIGLRAE